MSAIRHVIALLRLRTKRLCFTWKMQCEARRASDVARDLCRSAMQFHDCAHDRQAKARRSVGAAGSVAAEVTIKNAFQVLRCIREPRFSTEINTNGPSSEALMRDDRTGIAVPDGVRNEIAHCPMQQHRVRPYHATAIDCADDSGFLRWAAEIVHDLA